MRGAATSHLALGVYRDTIPIDLTPLDGYEQGSGTNMAIAHWFALWGGWMGEFSRADLERIAARGTVPLITWEPWAGTGPEPQWSLREAILSGKHDAYIESWARGLADYGRPVLLRFAHEMHQQPEYPWAVGVNGNTAEEYVAAWRHVRAIFERAGASNVEWVWNPNTLAGASAETYVPIYASLYPGDELVDWIGLSVYNTGGLLPWGEPYWGSFSQVLAEPYEAITHVSPKPLILPEVGCTEIGGSKAEWIVEALSPGVSLRFPRLQALVWFDITKEQQWELTSSPETLRAWLSAAAAMAAGRLD
jgi:hypothetical protein